MAVLLAGRDREFTLYDRFDTPRAVGSGLVIQPVGQAVLDQIGAGEAARALGQPITRMTGRETGQGRVVLDVHYARRGDDRYGLAIHRASLFQALFDRFLRSGGTITTSAEVAGSHLDPSGRWLTFADDSTAGPFALVIDASGARSRLSPLRDRPLGYGAIWGTVPWPGGTALPIDALTQRYHRASRMAGILPIGRLTDDATPLAAIFWSLPVRAFDEWRTRPIADWKAEATAFWPDFAPFLDHIRDHGDMVASRYAHGTLARPYDRRIAYVGDAAHRASPQLGQGANMALLDALALAEALQGDHDDPLAAYAAMRRWHVRIYQTMSWAFTPQYQSDSRILPWLRDRVMMPLSRMPPVPGILTRLVGGDLIPPLAGTAFP
ncbi:MAG: FAD-dependent monooxygenase [Rhodobacteraceae bacterium]|nr:FAD-dependent monooxygenase [Paracoccaceae bacterium]